eukprot:4815217-Amphidinium_carterae.1
MSMGFLMKSLLADFGIAVGTLVKLLSKEHYKKELRSSQTPQQPELLHKGKDLDVKSTSMYDGCGCKTKYLQRKRQLSLSTQQSM